MFHLNNNNIRSGSLINDNNDEDGEEEPTELNMLVGEAEIEIEESKVDSCNVSLSLH